MRNAPEESNRDGAPEAPLPLMFFPTFAGNFLNYSHVLYSKNFNRKFQAQKIFAGDYRFANTSISTNSTTGTSTRPA